MVQLPHSVYFTKSPCGEAGWLFFSFVIILIQGSN